MDNNVAINILDILNRGISDAIDLAVNKYVAEQRADFNIKLDTVELRYEALFADYDAKLEKLREQYNVLIGEFKHIKELLMSDPAFDYIPMQEQLPYEPAENGADEANDDNDVSNELVRVLAADFLAKQYGKDNGDGLIGRKTESVVSEFYSWCDARHVHVPSGKGQKRVVTNTAKKLFDLILVNNHNVFARACEVSSDAE